MCSELIDQLVMQRFGQLNIFSAINNDDIVHLKVCIFLGHGNMRELTPLSGWTPLMWAVCADHQNPKIILELLESGADVNLKTIHGNTALALICNNGNTDVDAKIVEMLLEYGADTSIRNNENEDALSRASDGNHRKIVALLVRHNCGKALARIFGNDLMSIICEYV
jgi:ankyrin repeat protein